jgi:hypothetical protein
MHRSGTSFLARALNMHGVYLGNRQNLISHDVKNTIENPKGHWENRDFLEMSKKILQENNGAWDMIPVKISVSDELKKKYQKKIEELMKNSPICAGTKDPRLLLILKEIKDVMPVHTIVAGIFRDPLKVAESLKNRNNFSYEKSIQLWTAYNKRLLQVLEDYGGYLFNFDSQKTELINEINSFVKKTGLIENELSNLYDEELFRSDKTFKKIKLPEETEIVYQKLLDRSKHNKESKLDTINFTLEETQEIIKLLNEQLIKQSEEFQFINNNFKLFLRNKLAHSKTIVRLAKIFKTDY